jgi:hypothetical protein
MVDSPSGHQNFDSGQDDCRDNRYKGLGINGLG